MKYVALWRCYGILWHQGVGVLVNMWLSPAETVLCHDSVQLLLYSRLCFMLDRKKS